MKTRARRLSAAIVASAVPTLLLAGCSSSSKGQTQSTGVATQSSTSATSQTSAPPSGSTAPSASAGEAYDTEIAKLVPASIRQKGTLTIAANATYPPDEYFAPDNKTVIGFDPDLAQAVGQILGLKLQYANTAFANIIPGLQAGHFDIGWSSATATAERQKVVNFVTYFNAGVGFIVPSDSNVPINGLADLCGLKLAVEAGSLEDRTATTQSTQCTSAGKAAIAIQRYQTEDQNLLALSSGRAQVSTAGSQIIPYLVKQSSGKFKSVGQAYSLAPLGVEFPKSTPIGLAQAFQAALNKMISDGSYVRILTKWGEQGGAISKAELLPEQASSSASSS